MKYPFQSDKVRAVFNGFDRDLLPGLLILRDLIFDTAAEDPRIGPLEETLKWNQPAYLTPTTKSGSTIRIAPNKTGGVAIYTHCQTTIMADMQALFPEGLKFEGNRAVHLHAKAQFPTDPLRVLIRSALTYHLK